MANKIYSKIIAREFLLFLASSFIVLIVWVTLLGYNLIAQNYINNVLKSATNEAKNIEPLIKKENNQKWFYSKLQDLYVVDSFKLRSMIIQTEYGDYGWNDKYIKSTDSYSVLNRIESLGFTSASLNDFFNKNHLDSTETKKIEQSTLLMKSFQKEASLIIIIDNSVISKYVELTIWILATIVYLIRGLLYAIKWSINTLKEQS